MGVLAGRAACCGKKDLGAAGGISGPSPPLARHLVQGDGRRLLKRVGRAGGRLGQAEGILVVKRTRRRRRNQRAITTIGVLSCGGRMAGGFLNALAGRAGRQQHACGEKI